MAPPVPRSEPQTLTAGTTWQWNRYFPLYQTTESPDWTITYYLVGPSKVQFTAAIDPNNGSEWLVSQPPAFSASLEPGTYQWVAVATRTVNSVLQTFYAARGVFTLIPNYITLAGSRSFNERMLSHICARLEERMKEDTREYSIAGRRLVREDIEQLEGQRAKYEYAVAQERRPGRSATTYKIQFGSPGGIWPDDPRLLIHDL